MRKKSLFVAVILSLACILLLSCSNHQQNASVSLKIMYDNSDEFFRKYGNVFLTKFPEYQIDVIPLDQSISISVNNMFGIYSKSNHSEAAFKFLEFICSKDFAHTMLRSGINDQLIANEDVIKEMDNSHNIEAFYELRPIDMVYPVTTLHFGTKMYELGDEAIRSIIEGEKNLDTALKQLQEESQYLLEYEIKEDYIYFYNYNVFRQDSNSARR